MQPTAYFNAQKLSCGEGTSSWILQSRSRERRRCNSFCYSNEAVQYGFRTLLSCEWPSLCFNTSQSPDRMSSVSLFSHLETLSRKAMKLWVGSKLLWFNMFWFPVTISFFNNMLRHPTCVANLRHIFKCALYTPIDSWNRGRQKKHYQNFAEEKIKIWSGAVS